MVMSVSDLAHFLWTWFRGRVRMLVLFLPYTAPRLFGVVISLAVLVLTLYGYISAKGL